MLFSDFISFPERGTGTTLRKCADCPKPGWVQSFLKRGIPQRNLEGVQTSKEMLVVSINKNEKFYVLRRIWNTREWFIVSTNENNKYLHFKESQKHGKVREQGGSEAVKLQLIDMKAEMSFQRHNCLFPIMFHNTYNHNHLASHRHWRVSLQNMWFKIAVIEAQFTEEPRGTTIF